MHTFWGCLCSFLRIYVYLLSTALNNKILTAFWGAHKLPGKGGVLASAVGTRPPKCIQIFMHASLFICNIYHMADIQSRGPVVPYCNPNWLLLRLHCHPTAPRPGQALITDLEAIDKPDQKSGQISPIGLVSHHPKRAGSV